MDSGGVVMETPSEERLMAAVTPAARVTLRASDWLESRREGQAATPQVGGQGSK